MSKLTCVSCVGGTVTVPFGPIIGPGSDNDGEFDEEPVRRPKNNLTAPATSPVVYKSRPILQVSGWMERWVCFYQAHVRPQVQSLRTLSNLPGIYPRFPKRTGRVLSLRAIGTLSALSSRNESSRVSCKMGRVNRKRGAGVSGAPTIPHFSSLLAAKRNQSAALL